MPNIDATTLTIVAGVIATVLAQIATFATVVFNARQQRLREQRLREWEIEDRAAVAAKVVAASEALAVRVETTRDALAEKVETTRKELVHKVETTRADVEQNVQQRHSEIIAVIADNTRKTESATAAADAAYKEANHVNIKIEDLNERLLEQGKASLISAGEHKTAAVAEQKRTTAAVEKTTEAVQETKEALQDALRNKK